MTSPLWQVRATRPNLSSFLPVGRVVGSDFWPQFSPDPAVPPVRHFDMKVNSRVIRRVPVLTGDTIIVGFYQDGALVPCSIEDNSPSGTNTYEEVGEGVHVIGGSGCGIRLFLAYARENASLTVIETGGSGYPLIFVHAVSGRVEVDDFAVNADTSPSTSHTTAAVTTTVPNAYLLSFWGEAGGAYQITSVGDGFIKRLDDYGTGTHDKTVSSQGTFTESITSSGNVYYASILVALKPAAGAPAAVTGQSSAELSIGGEASGAYGCIGSSLAALMLAGSILGGHGVTGRSDAALNMSGSALGAFTPPAALGSSQCPLTPIGGAATGRHGVHGESTAQLPTFEGTASGFTAAKVVEGTSQTALPGMGGAALGSHGVRGTSSATITFNTSGVGAHLAPVSGSSASALPPFSGTGIGKHGAVATSVSSLNLGGMGTGAFIYPGANGSSTATLPFSGAIRASHGVKGSSSAPLPLGGTITGQATPPAITGASSTSLPSIKGSATGAHGSTAASTAALPHPSGAAAGQQGVSGSSACPLPPLGGTASGIVGMPTAQGASLVCLPLGGVAYGAHGVCGESQGTLSIGGAATGAQGVAGVSHGHLAFTGQVTAFHLQSRTIPPGERTVIIPRDDRRARVPNSPRRVIVHHENRRVNAAWRLP